MLDNHIDNFSEKEKIAYKVLLLLILGAFVGQYYVSSVVAQAYIETYQNNVDKTLEIFLAQFVANFAGVFVKMLAERKKDGRWNVPNIKDPLLLLFFLFSQTVSSALVITPYGLTPLMHDYLSEYLGVQNLDVETRKQAIVEFRNKLALIVAGTGAVGTLLVGWLARKVKK